MMRSLVFAILSALLVLTSVGAGVARGTLPAEGSIVICRGHASEVIYLDASGDEVQQWQICPEALGTLVADTAVSLPDLIWSPVTFHQIVFSAPAIRAAKGDAFGTQARAPPALI